MSNTQNNNRACAIVGSVFLTAFMVMTAQGETIFVTTTANGGPGSFSQAITTANSTPGPNTIAFQISGNPPFTIAPAAALPAITAPVLIDGTTEPGYTNSPLIQLRGTGTSGQTAGLRFSAGASTLRGLAISGFPIQAIELDSSSNTIAGNYIGTDITGTVALGNAGDGILVKSANNLIGGTNAGDGNLVSGNLVGIYISASVSNVVQGNLVGVTAAGTSALGNSQQGIVINGGGGNIIGGSMPAARNIISGNGASGVSGSGVYIFTASSDNVVQGNFIGTDISGTLAVANKAGDGITLLETFGNMISSNVISANAYSGISITGPGASDNTLSGNFIGTDVAGNNKLGNLYYGVQLWSATSNQIGGGNVISGNDYYGIYAYSGNVNNVILGNLIGLNGSGTAVLGNAESGIEITGAIGTLVGGTGASARNVLSGNGAYGVAFFGSGATGNSLEGNYIGTDLTGTVAEGNVLAGIFLQTASSNQIGGTAVGAGNLISGNGLQGMLLTNCSLNVIQGNFIGTKVDGTNNLGNFAHGIDLQVNANSNIIGGTALGAGNRIAWSEANYSGVRVRTGSQNNLISGNDIFENGPNGGFGIDLGGFGINANIDCETGVPAGAANNDQNYPVITNVVAGPASTLVRGHLDSAINKTYQLQFFANPAPDPSGYGQGQEYLGFSTLTLGNSCVSNFATLLPTNIPAGWVVCATAIDPVNNTSDFSLDVAAVGPPDLEITRSPNGQSGNGGCLISYTNLAGSLTLQQTLSLVPPVNWVAVTNPPELTNGTYYVTHNTGRTNVFFRLSAP